LIAKPISIDAIRIALGNTSSKTTIHRYLKELEEDADATLTRVGSLSDATQDLIGRLAARLHEEAQARVDQQSAAAATQRQQAQGEIVKLSGELATFRAQLADTTAAVTREQDAHAETRLTLRQRALDVERLTQQVRDLTERLAEHDGFRQSLEEKLHHAHEALEHYRTASREQREQQAHGEQLQTALNRALADQARAEAGRDAMQMTLNAYTDQLARVRETNEGLTADRTRLAAQVDAQQLLLKDYRARPGTAPT
jgi:chromosome segregation ATPase